MFRDRLDRKEKIAVFLVVLSFLCWFALPAVPFVAPDGTTGAVYGAGLFAGGEVTFWVGTLIGGRGLMRRLRAFWRRA